MKEFAGHPIGLVNLFFTEMWERFSYYGMRAILILYMEAALFQGGLAMDHKNASHIYGLYTMSVYLASMPGGFIADRYLGARYAVLIGGSIIALGHFTMAFPSIYTFYIGLGLIICGTGLLKPNMSSMVGSLYKEGDPRRDSGFSIYYMGVNIGATIAPIVCGWLAQTKEFKAMLLGWGIPEHMSWHFGFGAAGVGMTIGLINYVLQWKLLDDIGLKKKKEIAASDSAEEAKPAAIEPLTTQEKQRLGAIGLLFFFNALFWAIYEQGGSSLNVFAEKCSSNVIFGWEFPSSWLQSAQAIFVIMFAPVFSWLWMKMGDKQPTAPAKFMWGMILLGIGIALMVPASILSAHGKVTFWWLVWVYLFQVFGELCLSPVGLSTVTKLAPIRFLGLTMGVWFLGNSLGNYMAGYLSTFFDEKSAQSMINLYASMGGAAIGAGLILFLLKPTIKKLMGGVK